MVTRATSSGLTTLVGFTSAAIPRPDNRWLGPIRIKLTTF
jgi:hypothetical protein